MVRRILFALLALGPLTIALHYLTDLGETAEFVLAAASLIPLAWLIGEATEHAAEHTGPGIGGFLNATFGNAPELIIALLAVNQGLTEVVRGSLTGSVVGNLLLVLGFSLVAGPRGAGRSMVEPPLVRADRRRDPALPDPVDSLVERRSRPGPDRLPLDPDLDRAARRLRRRHRDLAAAPRADARRERRGDHGLELQDGARSSWASRRSSPRSSPRSSSARSRCSPRRSASASSSSRR